MSESPSRADFTLVVMTLSSIAVPTVVPVPDVPGAVVVPPLLDEPAVSDDVPYDPADDDPEVSVDALREASALSVVPERDANDPVVVPVSLLVLPVVPAADDD